MALQIEVTERRAFVIRARVAGATLEQCAKAAIQQFGADNIPPKYDANAVWYDIDRAQRHIYGDLREELAPFRLIQLERYEAIIRAHMPKALKGDLGRTDRVLQAMRDQNRLLGLSAPKQLNVKVMQVDARIEQLMESMGPRRQEQITGTLGSGASTEEDSTVEGTARHL